MAPASVRGDASPFALDGAAGDTLSAVTTIMEGKIVQSDHSDTDVSEAAEQRNRSDRRRRPTPMFSRYVLRGGRRHKVRRDDEREGAFVDVHGAFVLLVVLAIIALNLLDAFFTLLFLSHGGVELNPVVQLVLDSPWHPWPFILLKTVGIGVACAFLVVAKHFRPARVGLAFVFAGYAVLLGWHLMLLQYLPS